jgi:glycosyltransferase involved in cell wall biosynthesis
MTTEVANYPVFDEQYTKPTFQERALVFAGGILEQWNHHLVLSALEKIPQSKYVLCGSSNQYLEELKRLPGWDKVDYKGRVPHEQVKRILSQCAIGMALLRPGRNTAGNIGTMGNTKIFEEMMAGLPVVCTDFVLWREFVDGCQCGICVDPENLEEITQAVQYLLDHPDEAQIMGENGRRAVKERYNWAHEEKKLLELYRCIQG